ncbi:hypothetical protein BGX38DRAFT_1262324 [Terfezia claveryi]|nr:hypothetical protein BGX38DRAFT_1262324 [Terfezia claveryi]
MLLLAFLGLANQFGNECHQSDGPDGGFITQRLIIQRLTPVPHSRSERLIVQRRIIQMFLTPEAIIELENMKDVLASPAVSQQFRYDRKPIVYTDASVGTQDGMVAGGSGAVVVQEEEDGKAYICAGASSGLLAAQKNYLPH